MQNSHKTLSKRTRIKPFDLPCFTKSIVYLLISESFSAYDQQKSLFPGRGNRLMDIRVEVEIWSSRSQLFCISPVSSAARLSFLKIKDPLLCAPRSPVVYLFRKQAEFLYQRTIRSVYSVGYFNRCITWNDVIKITLDDLFKDSF